MCAESCILGSEKTQPQIPLCPSKQKLTVDILYVLSLADLFFSPKPIDLFPNLP